MPPKRSQYIKDLVRHLHKMPGLKLPVGRAISDERIKQLYAEGSIAIHLVLYAYC